MNVIRTIRLLIIGGFMALLNLAHAQTATGMSDFEVELQAIESTTPASADSLPAYGTFYSAQHAPGTAQPWPPLPGNVWQVPAWDMGSNFFLLDDLDLNYQSMGSSRSQSQMSTMDVPSPGGGGTNYFTSNFQFNISDYGTNLWLDITGLSNHIASLFLSNTIADIQYEIQGRPNLTDTNWISYGFVLGSELTNWTSTSITATNYPNLFLRALSWQDSEGSGLPDWWQLKFFGHLGVDPYGDPDGDGWNNLLEFQNGTNPNSFDTPSKPQLNVAFNFAAKIAAASWNPSQGSVTGYSLIKYDFQTLTWTTNNFSPSTTSFNDNLSSDVAYDYASHLHVWYWLRANYFNGVTVASDRFDLESGAWTMSLAAGPSNSVYLAVPAFPADATAFRLTRVDALAWDWSDHSLDTNFDIPITAFTNGLFLLTAAMTANPVDVYGGAYYGWFGTIIGTNTSDSQQLDFFTSDADNNSTYWIEPPYYDGRRQLKENLIFRFRAALNESVPLHWRERNINGTATYDDWVSPAAYEYAGFFKAGDGNGWYVGQFDWFEPFAENYLYRNFVFGSSQVDSTGKIKTGAGGTYSSGGVGLTLNDPPTNQFQIPTNGVTIRCFTNNVPWLASYPFASSSVYLGKIGVTNYIQTSPFSAFVTAMNGSAKNYWGLPFQSALVAFSSVNTNILYAGTLVYSNWGGNCFYPQTAEPHFQTVEYDFWRLPDFPLNFNGANIIPGTPDFSVTNQSDMLICPVGSAMNIAGYAKLEVTNSYYTGVYGYLGQYFDKAYKITNGIVTTNQTGILSPYGSFFATELGPVALVTMPDIDTGLRGTCTVYAVSLQLDANHDGNLNLSFSGADATSQNSPFIFWINNNYDRGHTVDFTDFEQDDLLVADSPRTPNHDVPDWNFLDIGGNRVIPCERDLEDFARLWVCGVTSNLLAALPSGSTVTLSWGDVGNPNSVNPTIDVFQAADSDGGTGYLTNSATAAQQIDQAQSAYIGRIGPGQSIQLNANFFGSTWRGDHFIWCGVTRGSGQLFLTIADGNGNVLGQTSVFIQLKDIKEMYERWTVGDNPNIAPTNTAHLASEDLPVGLQSFQYAPPQDTDMPYILFVHGWNQPRWEKDRFAETAYKRLYWQGYQGRFGEFRWPTYYAFLAGEVSFQSVDPRNFDNSEFNAWKSGAGLFNLLTHMNTEYPNHVYLFAHSHGNIAAGEALRLAGTNQIVNTYIAMQAAVASHAYDPTTPTRDLITLGIDYDSGTPDRYAHYWTSNSPSYFNGVRGSGNCVNFLNVNDWALTGLWTKDQNIKPDIGYSYDTDRFFNGSTELFFPTNTYEIFAYADEARSYAVGAQPHVGGAFKAGVTYQEIELNQSPYNFDNTHKCHSGEFRSDNVERWQFWNQVLIQMGLK